MALYVQFHKSGSQRHPRHLVKGFLKIIGWFLFETFNHQIVQRDTFMVRNAIIRLRFNFLCIFMVFEDWKKTWHIWENLYLNTLDTDSKLCHDTVWLSRTKHTDKTQAGLTRRNQICLDESLCTESHSWPKK